MTRCHRCPRRATHAVAIDGLVIRLCRRHAEQLVDRVRLDPDVVIHGRRRRLTPPALEGARR